ncbi:MAG TPA: HU family DNA-binding protein [Candidatus Azoamicus sp. OHIO2]
MQINKNYLTKQKLFQHLAKKTGLSKKNIDLVFIELLNIINDHMKENGPEKFVLPGFFKLSLKHISAQNEKVGINPFTKESMIFKAKPAFKKMKIRLLKNLRDIVNH